MVLAFALAWCLSLAALMAERLPAGWLARSPAWAPGGRTALVLLFFGSAALVAQPRQSARPWGQACLGLALSLPPIAAAVALEAERSPSQLGPLLLVGTLSIALLSAGAQAVAQAGPRLSFVLGLVLLLVAIGLPGLGLWGTGKAPWLAASARLSPLHWLGHSVRGPQAFDASVALFWAGLLGLLAWQGSRGAGS